MRKNILAALLLAPAVALAPVSAMAHGGKAHHRHHKGAYGTSKSMKKDDTGAKSNRDLKTNENMDKGTKGGAGGGY